MTDVDAFDLAKSCRRSWMMRTADAVTSTSLKLRQDPIRAG